MAAIIKNRFRIKNAKDFLENLVAHPRSAPLSSPITLTGGTQEELSESLQLEVGSHAFDRNLYMFVGRARPWPNDLINNTNDLSPPTPKDTLREEFAIWDAMLGAKKITEAYASLVIPRFDWDASGETVYKPYDDVDPNLFDHPTPAEIADGNLNGYTAGSLYVLTDEYHLFKCLSNNNNSKSTVKPQKTLTAPYIFQGADNYRWKYLTTVTPAQVVRFLTDRWVPVRTLRSNDGSTQWLVQQSAVNGAIDTYLIDNMGSGYTHVHSGSLQSASSNQATLALDASDVNNTYVGSQIHILSGIGAGSIREITAYDGTTRVATLDAIWSAASGDTYEVLPKLVVSGNGTGAVAKPIVETTPGPNQYKVVGIVVINAGVGYTHASVNITAGAGSGAQVRAVLSPVGGHGLDVVQELGAYFVMLNIRLQYEEGAGDFPISNDYRQIGVIRDLKNLDGTLATENTRIATKKLNLTSVVPGLGGNFLPDEAIVGTLGLNTATGTVIDFTSTGPGVGDISFFQDAVTGYNSFLVGMSVVGLTSGASGTIAPGGVVAEEIKKFDGEILYIENRRAVLRSPDQIEDIKAVIEF